MRISPIKDISTNNCKYYKNPTFTAHPDFYKCNSLQSHFFRFGVVALENIKGYSRIEDRFCTIFDADLKEPKKMLVIGIGNSQEVFSYLASIKGIIKNKPLNKCVDLYTVDLQSKPDPAKIRLDSFSDLFPWEKFPKYAVKSFIKDAKYVEPEPNINDLFPIDYLMYMTNKHTPKPVVSDKTSFRVNDEILNFVKETYDNPEKSKWDSRIQDVITDFSDEKFDIISANNVFGYVSDKDYLHTLNNINRVLKRGSDFISDPYSNLSLVKNSEISNNLKQLSPGIYQKI